MLEVVDDICKKNGIKYCIHGGTMLGAVRHGGFIPWDDDLDVAMLREEYIKFREACDLDLDKSKYFFQDHTTDPHYRWGYARIRRKDSEFVRVGQEHLKMQTGIFLDVFPLDGTPESPILRAIHCFICFVLRKILYAETGRKTSKTFALRLWYGVLSKIPHQFIFRLQNKLTLKNTKSKYVRLLSFPTPNNRFMRKWFEELEDINFEGSMFPGNKDYNSFLINHYGDYMQIPPPEKRRWHPVSKFRLPPE